MKDVSSIVDSSEMPVCPICDNDIEEDDLVMIVKAHELIALAHEFCLDFVDSHDDE